MKVALVHDWLVSQRGGENVLEAIAQIFPKADIFTLIHKEGSVSAEIEKHKIITSVLQKIPNSERIYRHCLPLMPYAIEGLNLNSYDLILSSSHCVAKGVKKKPDAFHVSYIHAPMRYMWDRFEEYFGPGKYSLPIRLAAKGLRGYFQNWDKQSAKGVDCFLANSKFIASKVKEYYQREAQVVYPFCDPEYFTAPREVKNYYLIVTALVPYKRVDLAVSAFNDLEKELVIVGDGPDLDRLKQLAKQNIRFIEPLSRAELSKMYSQCKALVFPGIEDFGIVPVEAMASGAPVIAFGYGGATETVTEETGLFFYENTKESLQSAIIKFETSPFEESKIRERGRQFNRNRFQMEYIQFLKNNVPAKIWSSLNNEGSVVQSELN